MITALRQNARGSSDAQVAAGSGRGPARLSRQRARTVFTSVMGPEDDRTVIPVMGPADSAAATPVTGPSELGAASPVMGTATPAAVSILGTADSEQAIPVMMPAGESSVESADYR
jgi:hypothetical protein